MFLSNTKYLPVISRAFNFSSFGFQHGKTNILCTRAYGFARLPNPDGDQQYRRMKQVKEELRKKMGVELGGYQPSVKENRSYLLEKLPKSQSELPTRNLKDSFDSAIIPLSTNIDLQNNYTNALGSVRFGRLMEDMDLFAVNIVFKYLKNPLVKEEDIVPHVIVTILVDEISFSDYITAPNKDIRISGHVSWVGQTSLEVTVWLEQYANGVWNEITQALFLMASRNSTNTSSSFINKAEPADQTEQKILDEGMNRKIKRTKESQLSLMKQSPNDEEQQLLHKLFLSSLDAGDITGNTRILPANAIWMSESKQANMIFSHPEYRNMHNKIFGGFLMRAAAELASMTAYIHAKQRGKLKHCGGISFNRPVDVGALVSMTGQVVYSEQNFAQVMVYAAVQDALNTKQVTTNVFNYTFQSPEIVRQVVPNTYSDAMIFLDGRRHFQNAFGLI